MELADQLLRPPKLLKELLAKLTASTSPFSAIYRVWFNSHAEKKVTSYATTKHQVFPVHVTAMRDPFRKPLRNRYAKGLIGTISIKTNLCFSTIDCQLKRNPDICRNILSWCARGCVSGDLNAAFPPPNKSAKPPPNKLSKSTLATRLKTALMTLWRPPASSTSSNSFKRASVPIITSHVYWDHSAHQKPFALF